LFGNFGKDAKDLFKKKYEFDNNAKFTSRSATGGVIETTVVQKDEQPLRGVFKATLPVTTLGSFNGEFESEFHTVADKESKTTYKLTNLSKGVAVKFGLTGVKSKESSQGGFPEGWASAEVEYQAEHVTGVVGVRTDSKTTLVDVSSSLGHDNLSVGAKVTLNTADKGAPNDYNFGAQYNGSDYIASAFTENKRSVLNVSYYQRLGDKVRFHNFGATLAFGLAAKPTRSLTVGTDYWIDADTSIRAQAKIDSEKASTQLQTAIEHRLLNPNVKLGVAADFNVASNATTASRVGVSLSFGDY